MTAGQEEELIGHLATWVRSEKARCDQYSRLRRDKTVSRRVRDALVFHGLGTTGEVYESAREILTMFRALNPDPVFPSEEELVEDAGLFEVEDTVRGSQVTAVPKRGRVERE